VSCSVTEEREQVDSFLAFPGFTSTVMLPPPLRYGLAGVLGGLYGVMVSWVVNCTLVEISVNTFFAVVSRR